MRAWTFSWHDALAFRHGRWPALERWSATGVRDIVYGHHRGAALDSLTPVFEQMHASMVQMGKSTFDLGARFNEYADRMRRDIESAARDTLHQLSLDRARSDPAQMEALGLVGPRFVGLHVEHTDLRAREHRVQVTCSYAMPTTEVLTLLTQGAKSAPVTQPRHREYSK